LADTEEELKSNQLNLQILEVAKAIGDKELENEERKTANYLQVITSLKPVSLSKI